MFRGEDMSSSNQKLQYVFTEEDEWERYQEVLRRARERAYKKKLMSETKYDKPIIRRLLGLEPPDWMVTPEDLSFFQGRAENTTVVKVRRGEPVGSSKKRGSKKRVNGNDDE
jgi:hypothetical protein